jgi:DNA-binding protein HU-beta
MNKQELIDAVADETDLAKATVSRVLDAQAELATLVLQQGGEVTLPGLGKLKTKQSAARTGRNPATGEEMEIPAKTGVKFVAAKALKDAVA